MNLRKSGDVDAKIAMQMQEKQDLQSKLEKLDRNSLKWEKIVDMLKNQLAEEKSEHEQLQNNIETFKNKCIAEKKEVNLTLREKEKEIGSQKSKIASLVR